MSHCPSSFSRDGFHGHKFNFMLSNPPFGVSWKKEQEFINNEANDPNGRFYAGLAEKVLLHFAHRNVPVLALHDGFRIDARLFDEPKQVMYEIIFVNFKRYIPISNDDLQPLMESMLVKMQQNIDEGIINGEEVCSFMKDVEARVDRMERQLDAVRAKLNDSVK